MLAGNDDGMMSIAITPELEAKALAAWRAR